MFGRNRDPQRAQPQAQRSQATRAPAEGVPERASAPSPAASTQVGIERRRSSFAGMADAARAQAKAPPRRPRHLVIGEDAERAFAAMGLAREVADQLHERMIEMADPRIVWSVVHPIREGDQRDAGMRVEAATSLASCREDMVASHVLHPRGWNDVPRLLLPGILDAGDRLTLRFSFQPYGFFSRSGRCSMSVLFFEDPDEAEAARDTVAGWNRGIDRARVLRDGRIPADAEILHFASFEAGRGAKGSGSHTYEMLYG